MDHTALYRCTCQQVGVIGKMNEACPLWKADLVLDAYASPSGVDVLEEVPVYLHPTDAGWMTIRKLNYPMFYEAIMENHPDTTKPAETGIEKMGYSKFLGVMENLIDRTEDLSDEWIALNIAFTIVEQGQGRGVVDFYGTRNRFAETVESYLS